MSEKEDRTTPGQVRYFMSISGSEQDISEDGIYEENRKQFYPKEVYLTPAKSIYSTLNHDQAVQKVIEELKGLIKSPQFKECFLRNAGSIRLDNKVIL